MNPRKIHYLDGIRFRRAIIAGANWVIHRQKHLDDINVFPVADSDTGTNMASTMKSIVEAAGKAKEPSVQGMSEIVAESALMGARGNSGAILAQFFQGLAEGFKGQWKVTTAAFGKAAHLASEWARDAISKPQEGTILTVIRDWASHVKSTSPDRKDFIEVMKESLHKAKESLAKTPEQLKVLKKAGVVDAGAQGFVYMLEGILHFIEKGKIDKELEAFVPEDLSGVAHVKEAPEDIRYQYCTECLVVGKSINRNELRDKLEALGDSLIVAGSSKKIRIHIHTDHPKKIFNAVSVYGEIQLEKVDDMRQQHVDAFSQQTRTIAIVTDTGCDLPEQIIKEYNIHQVPVRINFGPENYIDKFTMTNKEFYQKLLTSEYHPKTSQPTPGDFKRIYELVTKHFQSVISIHLPERVSGTFQSAKHVAEMVSDKITVIDGKSVSMGLGLVVLEAARAVKEGLAHNEIVKRVEEAIKKLRVFISVETMDYLVRGGRVSKVKGILGKLLKLKPILTLDENGAVKAIGKTIGGKSAHKKTMDLLIRAARGKTNLRFSIAHAHSQKTAEWYAEQIQKYFKPKEIIMTEVSPALGVHGGPGAAGIAFISD